MQYSQLAEPAFKVPIIQRVPARVPAFARRGIRRTESEYHVEKLHPRQLQRDMGSRAGRLDVWDKVGTEVYDGYWGVGDDGVFLCVYAG